jgi:hypothetical protein
MDRTNKIKKTAILFLSPLQRFKKSFVKNNHSLLVKVQRNIGIAIA